MAHEVAIRRKAQKQLARVHPQDRDRVGAAAFGLSDDPRPRGSRKMRGTGGAEDRRIAVGDYRVVYRVEEPHPDRPEPEEGEPSGLVTVLAVGHRQGIYG
ncbi:MAG: type II toxin-antitoxin system RelE/ParE family toxin [Actinomycetota bacterium]|nr:type II toxin-antitoxin system RelE/ParE family toxin [Actinomycetota bacterium]